MDLTENDAALYRLYAVGMLKYDEALKQADNVNRLRRAMLHFDHVSQAAPAPEAPAAPAVHASTSADIRRMS